MNIALFGGTFDPVHHAHLAITSEATRACGLDRVLFIPCWQSPHKRDRQAAPAKHRLAMLHLATGDLPWAEISSWEIDREAPSYSWMTARHFAETFPDTRLHWILGADQWNVITTWAEPQILADLLTFIVFPRNGVDPVEHDGFRHRLIDIETPGSSTAIRRKVRSGESIEELTPGTVAAYIREHRLYQ